MSATSLFSQCIALWIVIDTFQNASMHEIKHSWKHVHSYTVPLFGLESVHAKVFNEIEHLDTFFACVKLYYASKNVNSIQFCWYFFACIDIKILQKGLNKYDCYSPVCMRTMKWMAFWCVNQSVCVYRRWSETDVSTRSDQ